MNASNLSQLKEISVQIIAHGVLGNSLMTLTALIGCIMSTAQLLTIYNWKPLRDMQQTLVVNAAVADALKSVTYMLVGIKRICFAAMGMDEVTNQFECMFWIFPAAFTSLYGLASVLMLSVERLAVIAVPVWYWNHKRKLLRILAAVSIGVSLVSLGMFIGVSSERILLSCNLMASTTAEYYQLMVYFQDIATAGIILISFVTCAMLCYRWRAAVRAEADINAFKRDVQFNAIKAVLSVVVLCLITFFSGLVFMALIEKFDRRKKAFYGPFWGCLSALRGVFDYGLWLLFSKKYRDGFASFFLRRNFVQQHMIDPTTIGLGVHGPQGQQNSAPTQGNTDL